MNLTTLNQSLELIIEQTWAHSHILMIIIAIPWLVWLLVVLSGKRLLLLGIRPRHLQGLPGIILAPLLHADFNHLFFNSIPLLVLSNFMLMQGLPGFLFISAGITILSGFAIWCFGKPGLHVGASALISGYWGYLVCNAFQQRGLTNIILGLLSLYYFAGIFLGIFPTKKGVSWEGHLFGLLAGIVMNFLIISGYLPLR